MRARALVAMRSSHTRTFAGAIAALAVAVVCAGGSSAAAATPKCNAENFAGALIQISGAAGSGFGQLILVNASTTTCHTAGFVGGSFLGRDGKPVPTTVTHERFASGVNCRAAKPCVVPPGAAVRADLHWSHIPSGNERSCPKTPALRIRLPGTRGTTRVHFPDIACGGRLIARPLRDPTAATND
jgi:hypothetical protein